MTRLIWAVVATGIAITAYAVLSPTQSGDTVELAEGDAIVAVSVPAQFDAKAQTGARVFGARCASCHGENAAGKQGFGPPLVHKIYEPGHHGDGSFLRAVDLGVRSHHWPFGDMPPVDGLTRGEVGFIVSYVRALQRNNGIQ